MRTDKDICNNHFGCLSFQKETDTNRCTTAMLNRCTNVRAGDAYYFLLVNKDPNKDHEQFHQKANQSHVDTILKNEE